MVFTCPEKDCTTTFTQKRNLLRHWRKADGDLWSCRRCNQQFIRYDNYKMHERVCDFKATGKRKASGDIERLIKRSKLNVEYFGGALDETLVDFRINLKDEPQEDILKTLKESVLDMKPNIEKELHRKNSIKLYLSLHLNLHLSMDASFITNPPVVLNTTAKELFKLENIEKLLEDSYAELISKIEEFQSRGSGWVLNKLLILDLHILEYNPLHASSYIPLPERLASNKAIINIQNKDQKCFLWSVIAGTFLKDSKLKDPQRLTH